jgi:hypothetical protein
MRRRWPVSTSSGGPNLSYRSPAKEEREKRVKVSVVVEKEISVVVKEIAVIVKEVAAAIEVPIVVVVIAPGKAPGIRVSGGRDQTPSGGGQQRRCRGQTDKLLQAGKWIVHRRSLHD